MRFALRVRRSWRVRVARARDLEQLRELADAWRSSCPSWRRLRTSQDLHNRDTSVLVSKHTNPGPKGSDRPIRYDMAVAVLDVRQQFLAL